MVIVTGQSLPWLLWVLRQYPRSNVQPVFGASSSLVSPSGSPPSVVAALPRGTRTSRSGALSFAAKYFSPTSTIRASSPLATYTSPRSLVSRSLSSSPPMAHSAKYPFFVLTTLSPTRNGQPCSPGLAFNCPWSSLLSVVRLRSDFLLTAASGWQSQVGSKPSVARCVKTSWSRRVWPSGVLATIST